MSLFERAPAIIRLLQHPLSTLVILALGFLLLWLATKDHPKPVVIYGSDYHNPLPRKKHPVVKIAFVSFIFAIAAAISYGFYHSRQSAQSNVVQSIPVPMPDAPKQPVTTPTAPAPAPKAGEPDARQKTTTARRQEPSKPLAAEPKVDMPILAPVRDAAEIPKPAPSALIPSDPHLAFQAVERMKNEIRSALERKETITFLFSYEEESQTYYPFIENLINSGCKQTPRQCWFVTDTRDPGDLDRPPVNRTANARGLIVHGDAIHLVRVLEKWFKVHHTSDVPARLNGYKRGESKHLIWIEIGLGSPWK